MVHLVRCGIAHSGGHEGAAAQWAPRSVATQTRAKFDGVGVAVFVCSGFDAGAALSMSRDLQVAALGYLLLISKHCPDTPGQRERFASWFSQQGVSAFRSIAPRGTLEFSSSGHILLSPNPKTRAQWADTLAELAILRFREAPS